MEARMGAQLVKLRCVFDEQHVPAAGVVLLLEERERLFRLAKAAADGGEEERGDVPGSSLARLAEFTRVPGRPSTRGADGVPSAARCERSTHLRQPASARLPERSVLILAGTLVHVQVRNTDRELAAYRLQADFVRGRLQSLPRRDHEAARRYVQQLDARARAFVWAERKRARH